MPCRGRPAGCERGAGQQVEPPPILTPMPDYTQTSEILSAYAGARSRIIELVRADDGDRWATAVPACPGWTAHDVLAHLAANTTDALAGRLTGPPTDEMTAAQVADRRDVPTSAVADEWEANSPGIDDVIEAMGLAVFTIAMDAITHEGDIRGAIGEGRPPEAAVAFHHHFGAAGFARRVAEHGLAAVEITADGDTTIAGEGDPGITLEASRYELSRAFLGRRSASQVREFDWSGDAEPYVGIFGNFALAASPVVD